MPKAAPAMHHLFVTGQPGCGKTTLIIRIAKAAAEKGLRLSGFYTDEVSFLPCTLSCSSPLTEETNESETVCEEGLRTF